MDAAQADYESTVAIPPSCPRCGSTDRGPFHNKVTRQISGTINGFEFTSMSWVRTRCLACGQRYVVRVPHRTISA